MRISFSLALLALTLCQSAHAFSLQDPEKDYWKNTGIKIDDFIRTEVPHCNDDALHLLGCVEALNVMAPNLNIPVIFAASAEVNVRKQLGTLIAQYPGGLNLYQFVKPEKALAGTDLLKVIQEDKTTRRLHAESVQALYSSSVKINFTQLFQEIKVKVLETALKDHIEGVTSEIYNANLAVIKDPHTLLWSEELTREMMAGGNDDYAGIGVSLKAVNGQAIVASNRKDGPALKAGLKIGDILLTVDGTAISGNDIAEMTKGIKGPAGTVVVIDVRRKTETLTFRITRAKIEVKNVDSFVVNDNGVPFGYIQLGSFMDQTAIQKIYMAIITLQKQDNIKGFILDLRQNGGGLLYNAVGLGGLFLGKKKIVGQKDLVSNRMQWHTSEFAALVPNLPMVTLIDGGSASASEIVAGALQDYRRSWIVGDRSYGKATVQGSDPTYPLVIEHPGVLLYSTIARFYQPSGRTNQLVGIEPDFNVDPVPNASDLEKYSPREEDNYTALPPLGKPWVQTRAQEVLKINLCRGEMGKAKSSADDHYQAQSARGDTAPDYRLLVAQDILTCLAGANP